MKYFLLPIFLFFAVLCSAQNGDNAPAAELISGEKGDIVGGLAQTSAGDNILSSDNSAQNDEEISDSVALGGQPLLPEENNPPKTEGKSSSSLKPDTKEAAASSDEPSLEDFLKRQEELWLQEKEEEKSATSRQETRSRLEPPSILSENGPKTENESSSNAAPAPIKAAEKSSPKEKQTVKQNTVEQEKESALTQAEIDSVSPQDKAEEKPPKLPNDWWGFFKGVVFTLVLGVAVWLLSKYQ